MNQPKDYPEDCVPETFVEYVVIAEKTCNSLKETLEEREKLKSLCKLLGILCPQLKVGRRVYVEGAFQHETEIKDNGWTKNE